MSAMAGAAKRRQTRDFMIAMTKFCGLFGVLEIYVSWVWDGMVKFIYWWCWWSSSSLSIKDESIYFRLLHLLLGRPGTVSLWLIYQFLYRKNAIFHSLSIIIELLFISVNFPFFVYLIFVQLISSLFSLTICFGTSVNWTLEFLVCSLTFRHRASCI